MTHSDRTIADYRMIRAPLPLPDRACRYGKHMEEHSALLTVVRAVAVLDGVDAEPTEAGVRVTRGPGAQVITWSQVAELLGADDPLDRAPRLRLAVLLLLHRAAAGLGSTAAESFREAARPLALPVGHPLHPGPGWIRERVPGDVLDLGIGVTGLAGEQDILPLPPSVATAVGFDAAAEWPRVRALGAEWGDIALARLFGPAGGPLVLAGAGGVDALTVLALPDTRQRLTGPVAAPSRDRAWLGLGRRSSDEEYLRAVWTLTTTARRGVLEPLAVGPAGVSPLRPGQRSGSSPIGS
jgi:hypothetical protein